MRWYDKPRRGRVYRTLFRLWLGGWNKNNDLYPVTWWHRFSRPVVYNTTGQTSSLFWLWYILAFLTIPWILSYLFDFLRWIFLT